MTEAKQEKKWYVVRAVSGQENKIKNYIENEISRLGLESFVDQVLVPTENVIQIRNGKKIQKPAEPVAVGDNITFNIGLTVKVIEVLLCGSRRGPASEARSLYREKVSLASVREDKNRRVGERPTKKNRRLLEKIRMCSLE